MALDEAERRRKIRFRAWHRGTREMDLILGRFVDAEIGSLAAPDLDALEVLLALPDPDLYAWITGFEPLPQNGCTPLLRRLSAFHMKTGGPLRPGEPN